MNDIDASICMEIAIQGPMTVGEVQSIFPPIKHKTVQRRLTKLVETKRLGHGRIKGKKSKRNRYYIPEENNSFDLWTVMYDEKIKKMANVKITQRNLSSLITQEKQFYRKEITNPKLSNTEFIRYSLAIICHCIEWINRLTWAINSGMFGDSPNKINLAERNRVRFENFLQHILYNLQQRNADAYPQITAYMYEVLDKTPLIEKFMPLQPFKEVKHLYTKEIQEFYS